MKRTFLLLIIALAFFTIQSCTKEEVKSNSLQTHKMSYDPNNDIFNAMNGRIPETDEKGNYTGECDGGPGGCVSVIVVGTKGIRPFHDAVSSNTYRAYLSNSSNFQEIAQGNPYLVNILNHVLLNNLDIIVGDDISGQFKVGLSGATSQVDYITTLFAK